MLTWLGRSGSGLACAALGVIACSVDSRALSSTGTDDSNAVGGGNLAGSSATGGSSNLGTAGESGALGSGDAPGIDEPSSNRSCVGEARARRCTIDGASFLLDPAGASVPSEVSSFQLDELEVTVGRFRQFVASFPGAPEAGAGAHPELEHSGFRSEWTEWLPSSKAKLIESLHCNAGWETWSDAPEAREDYPLTCASYYVAFAFCAWSGGRLPTEAEWEYAASGGAQQRGYPWGNEAPSSELALFDASAIAPAGGHRLGMARFGQLDLAGSAWEWTLDLFRPYPAQCDHCAELEEGSERVLRGGAFVYEAEYLKASYRFHTDPQLSLGDVGFRCAYDL